MKFIRIFIAVCLFYSQPSLGSDSFLTADELGSWAWSGFNLHTGKLKAEDVKDMVESGAKVARFHLEASRCANCIKYSVNIDDSQRLSRIIGFAKIYGLKIIIVLDPFPRGKEADYWESEERKESLATIWRELAKKYSNEPTVAAFDLLNEPFPPDAQSWSGGSETWDDFAERLVKAIRVTDNNHALIVESAPIALPGAFGKFTPLPFSNILYSFHFYEPHRLTHQGILGFPIGLDYPGSVPGKGYWNKARLSESLDPVRKFKARYQVPVQVGEIGFIRWAPIGARSRYLKDFLDLVYKEQWGWLYHSYREWEGWDAEINTNLKDVKIRSSSSPDFELIKSYLKKPGIY